MLEKAGSLTGSSVIREAISRRSVNGQYSLKNLYCMLPRYLVLLLVSDLNIRRFYLD